MKLVSDDQTGHNHDSEYQKHGIWRGNDGDCFGGGGVSTSGRFGGYPS